VTAKELARLEKQRKLAQTLRLKAEAEETGEDLERKKAWEWSIEQNERWEAKMEDQKIRGDSSFHSQSIFLLSSSPFATGCCRAIQR
jgi:pre-mRNA-splicing factor SYF2